MRPIIRVPVPCQNTACNTIMFLQPFRVNKKKYCSNACKYKNPEQNFWEKVDTSGGPDACWLWTASISAWGYGAFGAGKGSGKYMLAHIYSFELHYGPVPAGMLVCHNCPAGDNPACVNPTHLWLGTNEDNIKDAARKHRIRHGVAHRSAKLTESQVYEIRALEGLQSAAKTGREYNISAVSVSKIWIRENWRHLPELPLSSEATQHQFPF